MPLAPGVRVAGRPVAYWLHLFALCGGGAEEAPLPRTPDGAAMLEQGWRMTRIFHILHHERAVMRAEEIRAASKPTGRVAHHHRLPGL